MILFNPWGVYVKRSMVLPNTTEFCRVRAVFRPKNVSTLKNGMHDIVGHEFVFCWGGVSGDDEPFPGQARYVFPEDICHELHIKYGIDNVGIWCPREDLEILEVFE